MLAGRHPAGIGTRDLHSVRYSPVLLDFDHTLLDTETSLRLAFVDAMGAAGEPDAVAASSYYDTFNEINVALWDQVEKQQLSAPQVHVERFVQLVERLGLNVEPEVMANAFSVGMQQHGDLYPGAIELLEALHEQVPVAMVTNGLSDIQRGRIARLGIGHYFSAIVISAEVNASKPATEIFDITFDALGSVDRSQALMVGDSLSSDIAGGTNAGIATCWYNPAGKTAAGNVSPTHVAHTLADVLNMALGPKPG